ncbi:DUF896 domain-containing protein [Lacticaseibacillus saniviri]|uniref:UPF0291 protein IV56_GL000897 n=1 Tax=Lacticaseibacillus saniviri JCM 17471 = DSM 24301 TaxID=1293598 RepID=A0A0R2N6I4_9LACO|nr:DUF896 domain-containing protein [Lacticaseibacillus saniviri]KRO18618.1 hypothetical protein IV56_GL000897 [Lacticaseibacillus saniviri JCM 17471 = DSM 24301]MCG4280802.1 DUF896 domain-containing protein [Lacticaseibacillus saniviri]
MADQPKERIDRINELARKDKEFGLTEEEQEERKALREAYLKDFREGFRDRMAQTKYVDKEGHDVTPEKLRELQRERGWRDEKD